MFNTLADVLAHHARTSPDHPFVRVLGQGRVQSARTYAEAWERASRWAALLGDRGVRPGDAVILALPNSVDFVDAYFGALLAQAVPAPIAPLRAAAGDDSQASLLAARARFVDARALIVPSADSVEDPGGRSGTIPALPQLDSIDGFSILTPGHLPPSDRTLRPTGSADDLALIQFTSGTSGDPKAVRLTHAALLAQIRGLSQTLQLVDRAQDWGLSWLPLHHDMGLIGFLLTPAFHGGLVYLMPAEDFILRPGVWLKAITDFKPTIAGAPPSAFALCSKRVKDSEIGQYDLSSVRVALVGAEMISERALREFAEKFRPAGFRWASLMPTYGLAENSLAVTMPPLNRGPIFDSVDRPVPPTGERASPDGSPPECRRRLFVSVGVPLPGTEVAVFGEHGEALPERQIGEIVVRSPSLMRGYHRQEAATHEALRDGWLHTGDMGYRADGELYVTGRKKEVIIVGGRNVYPDDVEAVAGVVPGVRAGRAVAVGCEDPQRATEKLVVIVETALTEAAERDDLRLRLRRALARSGHPAGDVVLARPKAIRSTPSGKLKRLECKARYLAGEFDGD